MKRLFLVVGILVALILLAAPAVVGMQAEERYQGMVIQLEENGFRVVRNHYQRGWFESSAETELELSAPEDPDTAPQPLRILLRSRVSHGPFSSGQGLSPAQAVIHTEILPEGNLLFPADHPDSIRTHIGFDGSGMVLINLPGFQQPAQAGRPAFLFKGAEGVVQFSADQVKVKLDMPYLGISKDGVSVLEISGVAVDAGSSRGVAGLMLGAGGISVDRMTAKAQEGDAQVKISGLRIDAASSSTGTMVTGGLSLKLDSVDMGNGVYGPARVDARIGNLPAAALARFQQAMDEINSQRLPPDQQKMAAFGLMMSNGAELLQGNPKLALEKLHIGTPDGVIEGRLRIQSVGLQWSEISDLGTVLGKLVADVSLRMPEKQFRALFEQQARQMIMSQVTQQRMLGAQTRMPGPRQLQVQAAMVAERRLKSLLAQDILERKGADIGMVASLQDGLLTVNGKTLPLPMMIPPGQ